MDELSDAHLCLKCQRIFTSLDSYVQHRKTDCVSGKSGLSTIPSYSVVKESELRPNDFFQSLQLQSIGSSSTDALESSNVIVKIEEVVLGSGVASDGEEEDADEVEEVLMESPATWKPGCGSRKRLNSSDDAQTNDDHDYVLKKVPRDSLKVIIGPKSRKEAFLKHLANSTEHFCGLCKENFKSRDTFVAHLTDSKHWRMSNGNEEEHEELILNNSHLLAPNSPFKCDVCCFYFNSHDYLVDHWRNETEAHLKVELEDLGFRCSACMVSVKTWKEMFVHLSDSRCHLDKIEQVQKSGRSVITSTADIVYCPECDWTGKRQQALNFHVTWKHRANNNTSNAVPKKISLRKEKFKCSQCPFVGKGKVSILAHERRAHRLVRKKFQEVEESETEADETGGEEDDGKSEQDKTKRKYSKNHSCAHCGEVVGTLVQLLEHIKTVHPDKRFCCEVCSVHFELESVFLKHQNGRLHKYHVDGLAENTGEPTEDDQSCDQCSFRSFLKSGLLFHQTITHVDPVERLSDDVIVDENQEKAKREMKYCCPVCSEIFQLNVLRSHLITHSDERPYPCQWCNESFLNKISLASHIRSKHKEKKFKCTYCSYKTQRRTKLDLHLDIHQQKEHRVKKFLCDTCGAGFFNQSSLKHHFRLHLPLELGGKTQICSFPGCRLSFRSPSELVYHTRVHTGERPYLCGDCGYSAKTKHQLTKHERSHNGERPFKCRHCSYAAALSSQLLRHMRIHTGAKPYSCPYCEYTCNTHENLRKHVLKSKKHVGLNVYKCPHCNFGCNLANELKAHMLNEHSDFTESENPADMAFSSVVSGIFSRNEDRRDIDFPSTSYVPRTETPGYREKMKQKWKPKTSEGNEDTPSADENRELMIDETMNDDETKDKEEAEEDDGCEKEEISNYLTGVTVCKGSENDGSNANSIRFGGENFTVLVESGNGDDDAEATSALRRLLESNTIMVPVDDLGAESSSTEIPLVLNNVEMGSTLMEARDENGATVFLCMPVSL